MKLVTAFEDDVLKEYESRGASAFFTIFFLEDGKGYPSKTWMDFGSTILGWWIMSAIKLMNEDSPQVLHFMDGPYSLRVEIADDRQTLSCSNAREGILWTIGLRALVAEIEKAAKSVIQHLSDLSVDEKGRASLQAGLALLASASAARD